MKWIVLVMVLVGCQTDTDKNPIMIGGGGGGGGGSVHDAGETIDTLDASGVIIGQVCLVNDARVSTTCAVTGAGGFTVTLDGETTTTAADGSFVIPLVDATNLFWEVTGSTIVPSLMPFGTIASIPAILTTTYTDLLASNDTAVGTGDGSVFVRLVEGGVPLVGAIGSTTNQEGLTYYDNPDSQNTWAVTARGA